VWGVALVIWSVFVGTLDNFLRPFLIKKGADLPLAADLRRCDRRVGLVWFARHLRRAVVLAVTYRLFEAWVSESDDPVAVPGAQVGDKRQVEPGRRKQ